MIDRLILSLTKTKKTQQDFDDLKTKPNAGYQACSRIKLEQVMKKKRTEKNSL